MLAPRLPARRFLWLSVVLIALAFALRLADLDTVPLRGDEAFAVRYWADDPLTVVRDLAGEEPHPVGTFVAFYAWKQAAGSSEFAMRYLPLLGSVLGTAAIAGLGRRLFRDDRVALLAAGLWAIHPFLIWHAQDVRNYALWSGLSPLALLLVIRAVDRSRARDWAAYVVVATAALYSFFLEIFVLPIQALILLLPDGRKLRRDTIERAVFSWAVLAILLLPWLAQAYFISQSGYRGATESADPQRLVSWIMPTLLIGDTLGTPWDTLIALGWIALVTLALINTHPGERRLMWWFAAWIAIPALLLVLAAIRMSVFHPRYLIAIIPALVLLTARALVPTAHSIRAAAPLLVIVVPVLGSATLVGYYRHDTPKSPNWPALATYLERRAEPGDLIVQNVPDPAFEYYYAGPTDQVSLQPEASAAAQLRPQVNHYRTIWLVERHPDAEAFLDDTMQRVSFDTVAGFSVMQYRAWQVAEDEPHTLTAFTFAHDGTPIARLHGVTIQGPDPTSRAVTVLLYWEPLKQTDIDYKVFVHVVGAPGPDGSPLRDQDDHRPLNGFASTISWTPGTLYRDPYHVLEDPSVRLEPGDYTLQVGFYDPDTNLRLSPFDADGAPLGDSVTLATISLPPQ